MNRINEQFSDRLDIFYLDIDKPGVSDVMSQFDVRRRSTYVLLAPDGSELRRWSGPITEAAMLAQIDELLTEVGQ